MSATERPATRRVRYPVAVKTETCQGQSCASLTPYAAPAIARNEVTGLIATDTQVFWTLDEKQIVACDQGSSWTAPVNVIGAATLGGGAGIATYRLMRLAK